MTNYERIKDMSERIKDMSKEEMAEFLANALFNCKYGCNAQDIWYKKHREYYLEHCEQAIAEWLESEATE